jgi:hypothetical protein
VNILFWIFIKQPLSIFRQNHYFLSDKVSKTF